MKKLLAGIFFAACAVIAFAAAPTQNEADAQVAKVEATTAQLGAESDIVIAMLNDALAEIEILRSEIARLQAELEAAQDLVAAERDKITAAQAALEGNA